MCANKRMGGGGTLQNPLFRYQATGGGTDLFIDLPEIRRWFIKLILFSLNFRDDQLILLSNC